MAAGEHQEIHDVEQAKKITPFITRETTFWLANQRVGFWHQHI